MSELVDKPVFIYLTAYSPDKNIIASVRADKLSQYMSQFAKTYVVAGIDQFLATESTKDRAYTLINIPTRNRSRAPIAKPATASSGVTSKIARWVKAQLLPLVELVLPVSPGGVLIHDFEKFVAVLDDLCRKHRERQVVIMASYGPLFIWRAADQIKRKYPEVKVFIDFRDWAWLYAEGAFYRSWIWKRMTGKMVSACDAVTFVADGIKRRYQDEFQIPLTNSHLLPNGYDPEDLRDTQSQLQSQASADVLKVVYTGSFHNETRDPRGFLRAISECQKLGESVSFHYAGKDADYLKHVAGELDRTLSVHTHGFLPRAKSLELQCEADLLLLIAYTGQREGFGESILTGKVYEYLSSGRPMLVIAPVGWELRDLVESDGVSAVIDSRNIDHMVAFMRKLCEIKKTQGLPNRHRALLDDYSYPNLATRLSTIVAHTLR